MSNARSSESAEELVEICDLLAACDEEGCRVERTAECAHKKAEKPEGHASAEHTPPVKLHSALLLSL